MQSDATITVGEGAELGSGCGGDGDNGVLRAQGWLKKRRGGDGGRQWGMVVGVQRWC